MESAILQVKELHKRFGGVVALNGVDLEVRKGEIVGLIGPNGAGKTTLFNCVTGVIRPDRGKVIFEGTDITGMSSHAIAVHGIARTWQIVRPFKKLKVLDAVAIGAMLRTKDVDKAKEKAMEVLKFLNIPDWLAEKRGDEITLIHHKLVDLARALATEPKLLLIDEVGAGLRPNEINAMSEVLRRINKEKKITLIVVEHIMRLVMNISERIIVMHEGRVISQGKPEEVSNDPNVIQAYLGIKPV